MSTYIFLCTQVILTMEEQATAILSETGAFLTLMHSNSGLLPNSATLVMVPEKLMTFYHNVLV